MKQPTITPASEMRALTKAQKEYFQFEKACQRVMNHINKAKSEGKLHTLFNPGTEDLKEDVKREFIKHGYTFRPYGMCGGVVQKEENICW